MISTERWPHGMLTHCTHALTPLYTQPCHSKNSGWISQLWVRQVVTHSLQWLQIKHELQAFKNLRVPVPLATSFPLFFPLVLLGTQKQEAQADLRGHYFGCSLCLKCSFSGFTHGSLPLFRPILLKCHPTSPNLAWSTCVNSIPYPLPAVPSNSILVILCRWAYRTAYRMFTYLFAHCLTPSLSQLQQQREAESPFAQSYVPSSKQ